MAEAEVLPPFPVEPLGGKPRAKAFMVFSNSDGGQTWRIEYELADDLLPRTTDNFLRLCEAPEGQGYKGSVIHKVRRQMGVEFGDFVRGDGSGGRSALDSSGVFEDEGFVGRHTVPGTLTMCNHGRDTNNSVVFMSNAPMPHLDGTHVLFGRVTSGLEAVEDMSKTFCMNLRPVDAITIVECGEIRG